MDRCRRRGAGRQPRGSGPPLPRAWRLAHRRASPTPDERRQRHRRQRVSGRGPSRAAGEDHRRGLRCRRARRDRPPRQRVRAAHGRRGAAGGPCGRRSGSRRPGGPGLPQGPLRGSRWTGRAVRLCGRPREAGAECRRRGAVQAGPLALVDGLLRRVPPGSLAGAGRAGGEGARGAGRDPGAIPQGHHRRVVRPLSPGRSRHRRAGRPPRPDLLPAGRRALPDEPLRRPGPLPRRDGRAPHR